jgi:FixJ family two-component response regulator
MIWLMPNEGLRIELPPLEQDQLERWASAQSTPQQVALRCRIVLAAVAGEDNVRIAQEQGVSRPTVQLWRRRVHEGAALDRQVYTCLYFRQVHTCL